MSNESRDLDALPPLESRLEVQRELGRGGMGRVVLARDPHLGRTVAVKILLDEAARAPETRARFLREAQLTAQLEHPNILPVYTLEHTRGGPPAFTMKVIRGRTFDELVGACRDALAAGRTLDGDLAEASRMECFLRVCDAVAYAHERGVVHRDLKPENLMLGAFGEVYVLDWGIATVVGEGEDVPRDLRPLPAGLTTATQAGFAVGTPAYMSPEQAAGEVEQLGPASDQYALGLVLQELVSLQRANDTGDLSTTLARAIRGEREPLSLPRGRTSRDLAAIVARATALEPGDRYPSVLALADDVRRYLRHEETLARPDRWWRRPVRWTIRHPAGATSLLLGGALLALVIVAGVAVAGMAGVAASQAAAHQRQERLASLVRSVDGHAHRLDTDLQRYESLLERLASATGQLLVHGRPDPRPFYTLGDLQAGVRPDDFAPSDRYGQGLSLRAPTVVLAPGVTREALAPVAQRLGPLVGELHGAVVRSYAPDATRLSEPTRRRIVLEHGAPLVWSYVGLEEGLLVNYPGNDRYSDDYDARERSWYKEARGTFGPRWGAPYPDDSGMGLLLPCNQAIYGEDGAFRGVASVSLALTDFADRLLSEEIPGLRTGYLVDDEGLLVLASDQEGLDLWAGLNEGRALDREPFPIDEVRTRLRDEPFGHHVEDGVATVWSRMGALEWSYVVQVDEVRALSGSGG